MDRGIAEGYRTACNHQTSKDHELKSDKQTLMMWTVFALVVAATLIAWLTAGPEALAVGLFVLVAVGLAGSIETLRRARSTQRALHEKVERVRKEQGHMLREIEGLLFLYQKLQPEQPLPPFHNATIKPDFALRLVSEIFARKDPVVVELGSGVSTVISALCLKSKGEGRVVSYEAEAVYADLSGKMLAKHGVGSFAELHHAPLSNVSLAGEDWPWYSIAPETLPESIDILVVDGPPRDTRALARYPALPQLFSRLSAGGIVYLDDGRRPDEQKIAERWLKEFPELRREPLDTRSGVIALRRVAD